MKEDEIEYKCDSCAHNIFEANGGDGHPAEYCAKSHWSGCVRNPNLHDKSHDTNVKDIWFNCPDYKKHEKR